MPSVSIPIIDQLVHPSIGLLTEVAVPGNPFSGFVSLTPPQNPLIALTYGLKLRIHVVGTFHGHDTFFPQEYDPPLGKMSVIYRDLSGLAITKQVELWTFDAQSYLWDEPLPFSWQVHTSPDVSVDLSYLQT